MYKYFSRPSSDNWQIRGRCSKEAIEYKMTQVDVDEDTFMMLQS